MSRTIEYEPLVCANCFKRTSALKPFLIEDIVCPGCGKTWMILNPLNYVGSTTRGTHIAFTNNGPQTEKHKTNTYTVIATADGFVLGRIAWFGRWRKYVFEPSTDCLFEETCLREIALFCQSETRQQVKNAAAKRKAAKA